MKHEFTLQTADLGMRYMMAFNQHPDLAPDSMPPTAHIGEDGPLLIVTGEYDDVYLQGRINDYYNGPGDWDYLIEQLTYDVQNVMWFELQNPPTLEDGYAELDDDARLEKWRNECHTYTEHGFKAEFANDEYRGNLKFATYSTCGTTGEMDEPFAGMIVGHMTDRLKSLVSQLDA